MKNYLVFLLLVSFLEGTPQSLQEYTRVIPGSDKCYIVSSSFSDKTIFHDRYTSYLQRNTDCGEVITVVSNRWNDTIISLKWGPSYFYGIYNEFLFIDQGTGNIRNLTVFDLAKRTFIVSLRYEDTPFLKSDSISYYYPITNDRELPDTLPDCPESIKKLNSHGYDEKRIYVISNQRSINTGEFECRYRE